MCRGKSDKSAGLLVIIYRQSHRGTGLQPLLASRWSMSLNVWPFKSESDLCLTSNHMSWFPLCFPTAACQRSATFCFHIKGLLHVSYDSVRACMQQVRSSVKVEAAFRDPSHSLTVLPSYQHWNPTPYVSFSPRRQFTHHHLALWQRRLPVVAPLSNPVALTPDTRPLPPIPLLQMPKPPELNVWFLFIHVVFLLLHLPHSLLNNFPNILYISKTSKLPVYGSCQEAVM